MSTLKSSVDSCNAKMLLHSRMFSSDRKGQVNELEKKDRKILWNILGPPELR